MPGRPAWAVFLGLASAIVVVDQLVKEWILANFRLEAPVDIVGDYVRITIVHNSGGLFGLFQNEAPVFALVSLVVIGAIVWFHARAAAGNLLVSVTLGLLLGGAIGNLIDRLRFSYVVDFVDAGIGGWRWYTFNVADSAISASLVLLIVLALWSGRTPQADRGRLGPPGAGPADGRTSPDRRSAG